jgi:DNA-binding PadR family transcriptional regulator
MLLPERSSGEPTYPEYEQLRQEAGRRARRKVSLTAGQRALLELIAEGRVTTIRHLRGGEAIRIPTQRSKGRCGHLGRDVSRRVRALARNDWCRETEGEQSNKLWQLTDAGRAVLEA